MGFVIPAKAGIRMVEAKPAAQNQAPSEANVSLPPSWGKARMGVPRALARVVGIQARQPLTTNNYPLRSPR